MVAICSVLGVTPGVKRPARVLLRARQKCTATPCIALGVLQGVTRSHTLFQRPVTPAKCRYNRAISAPVLAKQHYTALRTTTG